MSLKDGVLYFDHRLVVPTVLRKEILERVHALGHFGMAGILEALRRSYYWPKIEDGKGCKIILSGMHHIPKSQAISPIEGTNKVNVA